MTMPSQTIPIDTEWAESLVGLRLLVPDSWWVNCSGEQMNKGVIAAVDFTKPRRTFFQFELDSELGAHYPMRYDSVFSFADEEQENYRRFSLPRYPLDNPEGEPVVITRGRAATSTPSMPSSPASETDTSVESDDEDHTIYTRTDPGDWTCLENGAAGRDIDPVPFTGEQEEFAVDVTEEEIRDKLMDEHGDIRFYKVLEWCLPRFGSQDDMVLWEWQVTRMNN